jgi:hypothetical protein
MDDQCSLSPTEARVYPATSSMSQSTLNSCFSCASESGNWPVSCWCYNLNVLCLSVQNTRYHGTGMSAIFGTTLRCSLHPLLSVNTKLNSTLSPNPTFFSLLSYTKFWVSQKKYFVTLTSRQTHINDKILIFPSTLQPHSSTLKPTIVPINQWFISLPVNHCIFVVFFQYLYNQQAKTHSVHSRNASTMTVTKQSSFSSPLVKLTCDPAE